MVKYTEDEIKDMQRVVDSTIINCQKMHPKFAEGTSQHTLLKNRLMALYISQALITADAEIDCYATEALIHALKPVDSIISKCENGQRKHRVESTHYKRFQKIIEAMTIAKALIEEEISQRG